MWTLLLLFRTLIPVEIMLKIIRFIFKICVAVFTCLVASCSVFSGSAVFPVSGQDRLLVMANFEKLALSQPFIQPGPNTPKVRLYQVAFDGTLNDRERVPSEEQPTIVAKIAGLIEAKGKVHYYPGPGMQGESISLRDAMLGTSCIEVAEKAFADFKKVADTWRGEDPDVEIRVFVTGFSRGAATARHFMNLVAARDGGARQAFKKNPARFYALLFDTVSTGQMDRLRLSLPPTLDYLIHFVALDEARPLFKPVIDVRPEAQGATPITGLAMGYPSRINLVLLPGAHSDIGTAYLDGIGNEYLVLVEQALYSMGLHDRNCWELDDHLVVGKHDSRGLMDKALGVQAPDSHGKVARYYFPEPVADLTPDEVESIAARLERLKRARPVEAAGMYTQRHRKEGLELALKRVRNTLRVQSYQDSSNTIIPDSFTFSDEHGVRKLSFWRNPAVGGRLNTLVFDDELWSYFSESKISTLYISQHEKRGKQYLATYIDNDLVRVTPASSNERPLFSRSTPACERTPDGHIVSPIKVMILGSGSNEEGSQAGR